MTVQNLGTTYAQTMIPGTDAHSIAAKVAAAFGIGISAAADIVAPVLTAYDAEARKVGPYVKGSSGSEAMAARIAKSTGISEGRVRQALREMANLAAVGGISLSTYNPAKYALDQVAKQKVKDAAALAKAAANKAFDTGKAALDKVVPDAMQDAGSGILAGLGGLGDVARLLPLVVVVGGAIYAYKTLK